MILAAHSNPKLLIAQYFDSVVRDVDIAVEELLGTKPEEAATLNQERGEMIAEVRKTERTVFEFYNEMRSTDGGSTDIKMYELVREHIFSHHFFKAFNVNGKVHLVEFDGFCASDLKDLKEVFDLSFSKKTWRDNLLSRYIGFPYEVVVIESDYKKYTHCELHNFSNLNRCVAKLTYEKLMDIFYAADKIQPSIWRIKYEDFFNKTCIKVFGAICFDARKTLSKFTELSYLLFGGGLHGSVCLPPDIFSQLNKLKNLTFNRTHISHLPDFNGLENLQVLNLDYNLILEINAYDFVGLNRLEILILQRNPIKVIKKGTFVHLSALRTLVLAQTKVEQLEDECFDKLTTLENLDLSGSKICTINTRTFVGLENLTHLDLKFNCISELENKCFNLLGNLQFLSLANNKITKVAAEAFSGLFSLKNLDLSNNKIEQIPQFFFAGLVSLECLDVRNNPLNVQSTNFLSGFINVKNMFFKI